MAETPNPANPQRKLAYVIMAVAGSFMFLCCGCPMMLGIIGVSQERQVAASVSEADALWDFGKKAEASAKYRSLLDNSFLSNDLRAKVYGRVIEADLEVGDRASADRIIQLAARQDVRPLVNSPAAKELVAALEAAQQHAKARNERERKLKSGTPQEQVEAVPSNQIVAASRLYQEFDQNEVSADEQFKGKIVFVGGEVVSVEKMFGSTLINLKSSPGIPGVRCYLTGTSAISAQLKQLRAGSWITVRGECTGKNIVFVDLSDCVFTTVNN